MIDFDAVTLQELKIFEAFVKTGTTKAAASLVKVSTPTCTRAITSLEEKLRLKLFLRVKNEYCLTPEAIKLYEPLKQLLRSYTYSISHATPHRKKLKLFMPIAGSYISALYFIPKLKEFVDRLDIELMTFTVSFLTTMPQLTTLILNHMDVVLIRGEYSQYFDLNVWDNLANTTLVQQLYSSNQYLEKYGELDHYLDLQHHRCLLSKNNLANDWKFKDENGCDVRVKLNNRMIIDSEALAAHAVDAGNGIALLSKKLVEGDKRKDMIQLFPKLTMPTAETKLYVNKHTQHKNFAQLVNIMQTMFNHEF
jgi:DNA-binding transcriptional LysR family regulator